MLLDHEFCIVWGPGAMGDGSPHDRKAKDCPFCKPELVGPDGVLLFRCRRQGNVALTRGTGLTPQRNGWCFDNPPYEEVP